MGKVKEQTKYEVLNDLLGAYGRAAITAGQFWGHMKERGWGQDDIDEFCIEHHKREKEKDDEREKDRAQGSATASAARGAGGQEHGGHRESARPQGQEQGQEDNGNVPEEKRSRQVRRPLDINSEKGQKTLENEQEAAKIFSEHNPNRLYVQTDKTKAAVIDAIIVRPAQPPQLEFVAETKSRPWISESRGIEMTFESFQNECNWEWLITKRKLLDVSRVADALQVPFLGILHIPRDSMLLVKRLYNPSPNYNEPGTWLVEFNERVSSTQANCNGGEVERVNAYIDMRDAKILRKK